MLSLSPRSGTLNLKATNPKEDFFASYFCIIPFFCGLSPLIIMYFPLLFNEMTFHFTLCAFTLCVFNFNNIADSSELLLFF